MKQILAGFVVFLAAGCRSTPEQPYEDWTIYIGGRKTQRPWEEQPRSPTPPKVPPERALSRDPIHRYTDPKTNYEYRLFVYDTDEIVTVQEPGQPERYATIEEKLMFLTRVAVEWTRFDEEEKLKELRRVRRLRNEQTRDGLEETIANKRDAIRLNKERLAMIEAKISAYEKVDQRPPELEGLIKERDTLRGEIASHEVQLALLKKRKAARDDIADHRHLRYDIDIIKSDNLFSLFARQELLLVNIKKNVVADWDTAPAKLEISGRYLIAVHDRAVLDRLHAHLAKLRERLNR